MSKNWKRRFKRLHKRFIKEMTSILESSKLLSEEKLLQVIGTWNLDLSEVYNFLVSEEKKKKRLTEGVKEAKNNKQESSNNEELKRATSTSSYYGYSYVVYPSTKKISEVEKDLD